ncbi:MFS transporter [Pendulispora brunnea]|uniref:MFS transporter n=1 Tax=Pendulispora brunnea TaxID=2905690 RepID=A0ABZ2JV59_9BACT
MSPSIVSSSSPSRPFSPSHRLLTVGLLCASSAMAFEYMGVGTVMPATAEQLGGMHSYGLAFSTFTLAQIMGSAIIGKGDAQFGTRTLFTAGTLLFLVGCVLGALAPSWWLFLIARSAQGLGAGGISGVCFILVAKQYPESASAAMMAWLSAAWTIPGLIGPTIAGALAERLGWRSVFWAIVPFVAMAWPMAMSSIEPTPAPSTLRAEAPASRLRDNVIVQSAALTLGIALVFSAQGQVPWVGYVLTAAGVALGLWGFARVMPKGTLKFAEGAPSALWARFLISAGYLGSETFVPLGFTHVRGLSLTRAGLSLSVGAISWVAGSSLQARTGSNDRAQRRNAIAGALLLFVGVSGIGAACTLTEVPVFLGVLGWAIGGFGTGLSLNAVVSGALARADEDDKSVVAGALQIVQSLATALFSGLGTAWLEMGLERGQTMARGLSSLFIIAAVGSLFAVPLSFRTWKRRV